MKEIADMTSVGMKWIPYQQIMNVRVDSDAGMTIVHINLSYLIGWIVATNQNGEAAKTLWT